MDLNEDPRALEQKIEQATRIASHIGAGEQEIRTRAREIWKRTDALRALTWASSRGRDQGTQVKKRSDCGISACPQ
jgi:hypothetical protein